MEHLTPYLVVREDFSRVGSLFCCLCWQNLEVLRVLCEECCIGNSGAFLWDAGSTLNGFSGEQNQSLTALVEKEVLPCCDTIFANCTHRYQVSGN